MFLGREQNLFPGIIIKAALLVLLLHDILKHSSKIIPETTHKKRQTITNNEMFASFLLLLHFLVYCNLMLQTKQSVFLLPDHDIGGTTSVEVVVHKACHISITHSLYLIIFIV